MTAVEKWKEHKRQQNLVQKPVAQPEKQQLDMILEESQGVSGSQDFNGSRESDSPLEEDSDEQETVNIGDGDPAQLKRSISH